jgi:hypothetical protein
VLLLCCYIATYSNSLFSSVPIFVFQLNRNMDQYSAKSKSYSQELSKIKKKYNSISLLRLLCIVLFWISLLYKQRSYSYNFRCFIFAFIVLMRIHSKLLLRKD